MLECKNKQTNKQKQTKKKQQQQQFVKIVNDALTLVLLRGVVPTPLTGFAPVLKIAQPRGKIAPCTFKFILSLHFSEKISNLPLTPGVG